MEEGDHKHFRHLDLDSGILDREELHHNTVHKLFQGLPPVEQD